MKTTALVAAFALAVAACGGGDGAEVATLEKAVDTTVEGVPSDEDVDAERALLEFAQCMRDNGIADFPDPELDENGNFQLFGGGGGAGKLGDRDTVAAAFEQCEELIEGIVQDAFANIDQSELQDSFLEFAQCMRDKGIDMADPDFSGGFGPGEGRRGLFGDIDPDDPAFREAAEECRHVFEGFGFGPGRGPGRGPGGGGSG